MSRRTTDSLIISNIVQRPDEPVDINLELHKICGTISMLDLGVCPQAYLLAGSTCLSEHRFDIWPIPRQPDFPQHSLGQEACCGRGTAELKWLAPDNLHIWTLELCCLCGAFARADIVVLDHMLVVIGPEQCVCLIGCMFQVSSHILTDEIWRDNQHAAYCFLIHTTYRERVGDSPSMPQLVRSSPSS